MKLFCLDILLKQNPLLILRETSYLLLVSPCQQNRGVWCGKNGNLILPHSHTYQQLLSELGCALCPLPEMIRPSFL